MAGGFLAYLLVLLAKIVIRLYNVFWWNYKGKVQVAEKKLEKIPKCIGILGTHSDCDTPPPANFLTACKDAGVERVVLFVSAESKLQAACEIVHLQKYRISGLQRCPDLASFMATNCSAPIDLMLNYQDDLNVGGLPALALTSTEFCCVSWFNAYEVNSLRYGLACYSRCQQRQGK